MKDNYLRLCLCDLTIHARALYVTLGFPAQALCNWQ